MCVDGGEQYFFIHGDKYFGGERGKSRVVGNGIGYWRCLGEEISIYNSEGDVIGLRVNLKYFSESSSKNNWTMQKYRLTCEYDTSDTEVTILISLVISSSISILYPHFFYRINGK